MKWNDFINTFENAMHEEHGPSKLLVLVKRNFKLLGCFHHASPNHLKQYEDSRLFEVFSYNQEDCSLQENDDRKAIITSLFKGTNVEVTAIRLYDQLEGKMKIAYFNKNKDPMAENHENVIQSNGITLATTDLDADKLMKMTIFLNASLSKQPKPAVK